MLNEMGQFIQGLTSQYVAQLFHAEAGTENICYFYYEYVPLTVDKWVLEMGEELIKELQFQLLNLTSYLTQNGVKFTFSPRCVGLSKDITIKYFLNEFAIDHENKFINYK